MIIFSDEMKGQSKEKNKGVLRVENLECSW